MTTSFFSSQISSQCFKKTLLKALREQKYITFIIHWQMLFLPFRGLLCSSRDRTQVVLRMRGINTMGWQRGSGSFWQGKFRGYLSRRLEFSKPTRKIKVQLAEACHINTIFCPKGYFIRNVGTLEDYSQQVLQKMSSWLHYGNNYKTNYISMCTNTYILSAASKYVPHFQILLSQKLDGTKLGVR